MRRFKLITVLLVLFCANFITSTLTAQEISRAFEFRYVADNPDANGETDFKGETAIFNTEDRIEFLGQYAEYGKRFWNDPNLDTKTVTDDEVQNALNDLKPQPLPTVRERIRLQEWKWLGYKDGGAADEIPEMNSWLRVGGAQLQNGVLTLVNEPVTIRRALTPQSWRFSMEWKASVDEQDEAMMFELSDWGEVPALKAGFNNAGQIVFSNGDQMEASISYNQAEWYHFKIEADVPHARYNLYVNGDRLAYYVPMMNDENNLSKISQFDIHGSAGQQIDEIWGVGFYPTDRVRRPYNISTFLDEDFEVKPSVRNWTNLEYDDSRWLNTDLPKAHGSERHAGEDLYLRKKVEVGDFTRAFLNLEVLDPSGQVYVNGELAGMTRNRHPKRLDVTSLLEKNSTNIIAVKVDHFYLTEDKGRFMGHTPLDLNFGWFSGRISLDLTSDKYIDDLFIYTTDIGDPARLHVKTKITNDHWWSFDGEVELKMYPWFPEESDQPAATITQSVLIENDTKEFEFDISVDNPALWTTENPTLYKVVATLKDTDGNAVDDYVTTTGIRTVSQKNGNFHVNGEPAMLNGAQIFGARAPLSKTIEWYRCPPQEWVAKEILMIQKMNGNLMRIHVHGWQNPAAGVNDPRFAEMGDQMGIMFIWSTPAWIRTGRGWGDIDFQGYPRYMQQVQNHPSIVMWEVSNHPTDFRDKPVDETNAFVRKAYDTVYSQDQTRIISYTSYIHRLKYANDEGTLDHQGNTIDPAPEWTAARVTRGNQDSYQGYGREWDVLRKAPNFDYRPHLPGFLNSSERAYFNFEHEESIGQPNWNLVKGKAWYQMQSYEWDYDTGSIGRRLTADEWEESQAWQAFSAYEAMRKQRWLDYDGFSWCNLHGGPNTVTYKKPIIDFLDHAKLAYWANQMVFQNTLAGSKDVDVVYGPNDSITPIVMNLGEEKSVNVTIIVNDMSGNEIDRTEYKRVDLSGGRTVTELDTWKPEFDGYGYYGIEYIVE